jgi:thiopeptide-type bacteriocin biosynthesis protein
MEISEHIFFFDSIMSASIIANLQGNEKEKQRWLISLYMIDELLNTFTYLLIDKHHLLKQLQENFGNEFNITNDYRRQFGRNYRTYRPDIEAVLSVKMDKNQEYNKFLEPIFYKSQSIKPYVEEILKHQQKETLQIPLGDLLSSYIHLMLNRLFRTQPRKHELIIYDFLFRYYDSIVKRDIDAEKKSVNLKQ